MKILGLILYLIGFAGIGYAITETRIDFGASFMNFLLMFLWLVITIGIGTALMKFDNNGDGK